MKSKILFACDLDNTLIHSFKHRRDGDVCVEIVDGKEWGFMASAAIPLLAEVMKHVTLVPVTTRSIAQYRRIQWPAGLEPLCAATTNGAVLLDQDAPQSAWTEETERIVGPVRAQMEELTARLSATGEFLRCRMVDDAYAFVYCREMDQARAFVQEQQELPGVSSLRSAKKVYFFPEGLDKGAAVRRLKAHFGAETVICAGDSIIDVPMLTVADIAIAPKSAALPIPPGNEQHLCSGESFACDVLQTVLAAVTGGTD